MKTRLLSILFFTTWGSSVWAQNAAEGPPLIDVEHYDIQAEVDPDERFLQGEVRVRFKVLRDTLSLPFELNSRLSILGVTDEEGKRYSTRFDDLRSHVMRVQGPKAFPPGSVRTLTFSFEGTLESDEYAFLDVARSERAFIAPDGATLLTEGRWFPLHSLPLDAATTDLKITVPLGFTVVAPGNLESITTEGLHEVFTWVSSQPVTQVPVILARFFRQKFEEGPVPLTFFVTENHKGDLSPWAEEIGKILDFFESEYGQLPLSKLHLAAVGNVTLPSHGCFELILLESSVLDARSLPIFELATRIARHWWGYSVTMAGASDAFLQEGFAIYAALRYVEVRYADKFPAQLAREAVQALKYEKAAPITQGLALELGSAQYASIVGSKGAWVLYMLSQLIGREEFNSYFKDWFQDRKGKATRIADFADFVKSKSGEDYGWFFVQWVESVGVPEFRTDYTIFKLKDGTYTIRGQVRQNIDLFRMPSDLAIETKGDPIEKQLTINGKTSSFRYSLKDVPQRVIVDPKGKILHDSDKMRVLVHISLGEEYQEKTEFVAAIREYEKAKELDPRSSVAHYRLGEVYFEQHSYSNAANSFRDTLNGNLKPEWVETWTHIYLGKIYDVLGQRERAKSEYRKAVNSKIDFNGAQAEAQKYLAEAYSKPRSVIG